MGDGASGALPPDDKVVGFEPKGGAAASRRAARRSAAAAKARAAEADETSGVRLISPDVVETVPVLFEEHVVRSTRDDPGPRLFVASDLSSIIGRYTSTAVSRLDDDEKGLIVCQTAGGPQKLLAVTESGLYALTLRSHGAMRIGTKPHRFRKWVTSQILPSIRRTGAYVDPEFPAFAGLVRDRATLFPTLSSLEGRALLHAFGSSPGLARFVLDLAARGDGSLATAAFDIDAALGRCRDPYSRVDGIETDEDGVVSVGGAATGLATICRRTVRDAAIIHTDGRCRSRDPEIAAGGGRAAIAMAKRAVASRVGATVWLGDFEAADRDLITAALRGVVGVTLTPSESSPGRTRAADDLAGRAPPYR